MKKFQKHFKQISKQFQTNFKKFRNNFEKISTKYGKHFKKKFKKISKNFQKNFQKNDISALQIQWGFFHIFFHISPMFFFYGSTVRGSGVMWERKKKQ